MHETTLADDGLFVELDCETGVMTLLGMAPRETSWATEVLDLIRRGGSLWCSIAAEVIEMRVKPETLWYRLTGDLDEWGCPVAVRCDKAGVDWA